MLAVLLVSVLVAVVLLTRDDTAVTEADLAATEPSTTGPSTTQPAPDPGGVGPTIAAEGLPGAQLGQRVTEDGPWRTSPLTDEDTACRFVEPQQDVGAPGLGVFAAVVDEQIVSVVVWQPADYLVPYVGTPHDITMGEGLEAAALLPGADLAAERLPEPVVADLAAGTQLEEVRVVSLEQDGTETRYAELGQDRGIVYVEVRLPAADACRPRDFISFPLPAADELKLLSVDGWGPVEFGQPAAELVEGGLLAPDAEPVAGACVRHPVSQRATEPFGLRQVASVDGRVVGITVNDGRTTEGVAVGDRRSRLLQVYPGAEEIKAAAAIPEHFPAPLRMRTADGLQLEAEFVPRGVVPQSVFWVFMAVEPSVGQLSAYIEDCDG